MTETSTPQVNQGFCHEAMLYTDVDEFLDSTLQFVRDGFDAGQPTLVVVERAKLRALRAELEPDGERLYFADMAEIGRNPACIIPAWTRFLEEHGADGAPLRGVGEPIWPGRSPAEIDECHRHEALLRFAFAGTTAFWLRCPYDAQHLDPDVIDRACANHPVVVRDGVRAPGAVDDAHPGAPSDAISAGGFAEPAAPTRSMAFGSEASTAAVRAFVADAARRAGLGHRTTQDLVLAVHELATNSIRHGGGGGRARVWSDDAALVCEVRDDGHIEDPLVGRRRPPDDASGARGLWMANRLVDLLQLRSSAAGTTVRVHVRRSR